MSEHVPTVSVLMAVHNGQPYLAQAIESVLGQTFHDFEFLVLDDGSSDGSGQVFSDYAKRDERIRIVHRPDGGNRGLTASLNKLLAEARGRMVARIDGDDICRPERFLRQVSYLDDPSNTDCVCLGTGSIAIDPGGELLALEYTPLRHDMIVSDLFRGNGGAIRHPSMMARRNDLLALGGYDERYRTAQDLDLYLRLSERGRLANLPEVLLYYRMHPDQTNQAQSERQTQDMHAMLAEAHRRRGTRYKPSVLSHRRVDPIMRHRRRFRRILQDRGRVAAVPAILDAVRSHPFSFRSWKAFAYLMRGH